MNAFIWRIWADMTPDQHRDRTAVIARSGTAAEALPFPILQPLARRVVVGWILELTIWVTFLCLLLIWFSATIYLVAMNSSLSLIIDFGGGAILLVIYPYIVNSIITAREMRARRAEEILSDPNEALVVLIRSFADDDLIDPAGGVSLEIRSRYEKALVKALAPIGPAVALGRPGEAQPELGAARLYVEDEHWRGAMAYLFRRASAVLAIVGSSEGLWWEIEFALNQVSDDRLLFFFPYPVPSELRHSIYRLAFSLSRLKRYLGGRMPQEMADGRESRYQAFRVRFAKNFRDSLPPSLGEARFLHVGPNGKPEFLRPAQASRLISVLMGNDKVPTIPYRRELRPFVLKILKGCEQK